MADNTELTCPTVSLRQGFAMSVGEFSRRLGVLPALVECTEHGYPPTLPDLIADALADLGIGDAGEKYTAWRATLGRVDDPRWTNIPSALRDCPHWLAWGVGSDGTTIFYHDVVTHKRGQARMFWTAAHSLTPRDSGLAIEAPAGVVAISIERCIDEQGAVDQWAAEVVKRLGTYAEIGPTGRDLTIFARASIPQLFYYQHRVNDEGVRQLGSPVRVTGDKLPGAPAEVAACQAEVTTLWHELYGSQ